MTFVGSQTLTPAKILNTQNPSLRHRRPPTPPILISTKLSDVNPIQLQDLCNTCNHSFHRFPNILPDGRVEPVAVDKLRLALAHSSVVVSVFAKPELVTTLPESVSGGEWYRRMIPLTPVIPPLQGRGIGRMILQRIIRLLTNKGIYDIAALCSDQEMSFFKACGFGDDMLGSTTMMYTRSGNDVVMSAGRKLLMVPSIRKP